MTTPHAPARPRLSIGLPVFNGENYLRQSVPSILAQTFGDFELIICDNASTDGTEQICREFAAADPRVRYFRNSENKGAAYNFNRTFELSHGEFYKQAAHDDLLAPTMVQRCIEALDADPGAALAYVRAECVDGDGAHIADYEHVLELGEALPHQRFAHFLRRFTDHTPQRNLGSNPVCNPIFGVVRSQVYAKTRFLGNYLGADKILLAEIALRGRFVEVPEKLFTIIAHKSASWATGNVVDIAAWFDPKNLKSVGTHMPRTRHALEYLRAIRRAKLSPAQTARCVGALRIWLADEGEWMLREQAGVAIRLVGLKPWQRPTPVVETWVTLGTNASGAQPQSEEVAAR